MQVKIRFFARFRELYGAEIIREISGDMTVRDLIRTVAGKEREGYTALFEESGEIREFVVLMKNGKRIENKDAGVLEVTDRDEIAVFPPVAGG